MPPEPLILEIKGNSLDDGPGIRSVVFFKGCPLNCVWCHNPESKSSEAEIAHDPGICIGCDSCLDLCRVGALSRGNPYFIDRLKCNLCFDCTEECPSGALSRVGIFLSPAEILTKVLKDKPFFDTSGGGVTLSGGEPTLNLDYTAELLKLLRQAGIHTIVETCGMFNYESFRELALPYTNSVYMDIKLIDPAAHKHFCGTDNRTILENFRRLHELATEMDFEIMPRIPLVPGITDTVDNLEAIAGFLADLGVKKIQLLGYNPLWCEKSLKIGQPYSFAGNKSIQRWTSGEKMELCAAIFRRAGLVV